VVAGLLGIVLLLFELVLIARVVVDWIGVLSPVGGRSGLYQARRITHGMTEPVIGPVRRVLKPARLGSVSIDLAFTAVFVAVIVLRTVVVPLIPFLRAQPQSLDVAARPTRGGDGRSVLRDRVEYWRAHCVWWFVSVDPNHADVACPCGVLERRVVGCRTLDELRDQCLVGRAAVEVSIHANPPPTDQPQDRENQEGEGQHQAM